MDLLARRAVRLDGWTCLTVPGRSTPRRDGHSHALRDEVSCQVHRRLAHDAPSGERYSRGQSAIPPGWTVRSRTS